MFFDNYKQHTDAQIRQSLFWEYDMSRFDWEKMRTLVVQRVIERGRKDDFFAILNRYGVEGVKESIKEIPTMNAKDISFSGCSSETKRARPESPGNLLRYPAGHRHVNPVS